MIATVCMVQLRRLIHSRVELLLTFVVPVAFFSIFALIFAGGVGAGSTPKIKMAIVDEIDDDASVALVEQICGNDSLRLMRDEDPASISRHQVADWVRRGSMTMGIVIHRDGNQMAVDLLADSSDQVATQVVSAVVSQSMGKLAASQSRDPTIDTGNRLAARGDDRGRLPFPLENDPLENHPLENRGPSATASAIQVVDVLGKNKSNPVISMYAAGIAVMFLLFGATGGGGTLLDEKENQTLDRMLSTQMTMDQLLLGKWVYLTLLGVVQVSVMFVWAQIVFGVNLTSHFDGFLMMTLVTSAAAAALGLFLATLCRTRGQLNGLSVILILTMSALGGSMVPRYVMSEPLRRAGLWTFNAWALDGYDKIFWRELPVDSLSPQIGVLLVSGVTLLCLSRLFAIRWETE